MKNDEIYVEVGQHVAKLRMARGITQTQLAETLDVSPSYISCIEHGKRGLSMKRIVEIADALDASCDDILRGPRKCSVNFDDLSQFRPESFIAQFNELFFRLSQKCPELFEGHDKR